MNDWKNVLLLLLFNFTVSWLLTWKLTWGQLLAELFLTDYYIYSVKMGKIWFITSIIPKLFCVHFTHHLNTNICGDTNSPKKRFSVLYQNMKLLYFKINLWKKINTTIKHNEKEKLTTCSYDRKWNETWRCATCSEFTQPESKSLIKLLYLICGRHSSVESRLHDSLAEVVHHQWSISKWQHLTCKK